MITNKTKDIIPILILRLLRVTAPTNIKTIPNRRVNSVPIIKKIIIYVFKSSRMKNVI